MENSGNDATLATSGKDNHPMMSVQSSVLTMLGDMRSDMQSTQAKITDLEDRTQNVRASPYNSKGKGKAPLRHSTEEDENVRRNPRSEDDRDEQESSTAPDGTTRNKHWANRDGELMDYDTELVWDDKDDDQQDLKGVKLFKIGEKTEKFLASAFATAIPNATCCQWRDNTAPQTLWLLPAPTLTKSLRRAL